MSGRVYTHTPNTTDSPTRKQVFVDSIGFSQKFDLP